MSSSQKQNSLPRATKKQKYKQHIIALRTRREKEHVEFKKITNDIKMLLFQCEQQKGIENKTKVFKQICSTLKKHKTFVHAHPKFALVVSNKFIEMHNSAKKNFINIADAETFQMYCHAAYKSVFGCEFPIDKVHTLNTEKQQNSDSQIILELFSKINQSGEDTIVGSIQTNCESTLVCKYSMRDSKTHLPLFNASVKLSNLHDASIHKNILIAYISYFTVNKESRGQRKCTEAFTSLLNHLKSLQVDVITLYIGSNTPEKACACYIHGAKKSGYFILNSDAEEKCADGYRFVFTKENLQKKYKDIWSKLDELKQDHASYLLENYTQHDNMLGNTFV